MKLDKIFNITENTEIASGMFRMRLCGDTSGFTAPGQFVNIKLDGLYLRRPISVCDLEGDTLTLIYKVVGEGTMRMSTLPAGTKLDLLCGLGNGYDLSKSGDAPLLIGGGVGTPPLYLLCKKLLKEGKKPSVIIGFNSAGEVILEEEFRALGVPVTVTTVDGSKGLRGFVTDAMKDAEYSYFYTCGPMPMFRAVDNAAKTSGQFSFEERMGCGFGACMGCSCKTKYKYKRICRDGPVLEREEIVW